MDEEWLDVVDENDCVVGKQPRSIAVATYSPRLRFVALFIRNSKGELWIPRRTTQKKIFPSALDMSMAGYVSSGETYEQALVREAMEELNINFKNNLPRFLGKLSPYKINIHGFVHVYELLSDIVPNYNPKDFDTYFWFKPEELISKIKNGTPSKDDLPKLIKEFYLKL